MHDYAKVLVDAGKKVVFVGQFPEREKTNKLMHRGVIRIYTPGTIVEESWIETRANNFLLCLSFKKNGRMGLAWADIATGEFFVDESKIDLLENHLTRIQPREILLNEDIETKFPDIFRRLSERPNEGWRLTHQRSGLFKPQTCRDALMELRARQPYGSKLGDESKWKEITSYSTSEQTAAGALIGYIQEIFPETSPHLNFPDRIDMDDAMSIDSGTMQALEVIRTMREPNRKGNLFGEIDQTKTSAGARLLAARLTSTESPSLSVPEINRRLDLVEVFFNNSHLTSDVRDLLSTCRDIERSLQRMHFQSHGPVDYTNILTTLNVVGQIKLKLSEELKVLCRGGGADTTRTSLEDLVNRMADFTKVLEQCRDVIDENARGLSKVERETIRDGVSTELDEIRGSRRMLEETKKQIQSRLGEATRSVVGYLPENFALSSDATGASISYTGRQRKEVETIIKAMLESDTAIKQKQTTLRFTHTEWTSTHQQIVDLEDRMLKLENDIFTEYCEKVQALSTEILDTCKALAEVDVSAALASKARECDYVRPIMTDEIVHDIKDGRHPVVERAQTHRETMYIPNDCLVAGNQRLWVVTGPNMGGKSTFLRQCAVISILAQSGSYVPASYARLGIVDKVFARVGASDHLAAHQSTFMVEMQETQMILNNATTRSFAVMDEVGRGTSTIDGISIAWAIIRHLQTVGCRALFATHYHELGHMIEEGKAKGDDAFSGVGLFKTDIRFDNKTKAFHYVYKIVQGVSDESHGIAVAEIAGKALNIFIQWASLGFPQAVIDEARRVAAEIKKEQEMMKLALRHERTVGR
ncbi:Mismatch repair protein msh3 [Borealophlyctis nickersoniae]|nr:Mismatch repair protein msh3 [Borealophlyctis nickersoniae]